MPSHLTTLIRIKPWLLGILLSAAGMILGYALGSEAARLLGGEPGIWARLAKGFVWGGLIAGLQWPLVRAAGVHPLRFIATSAAGFAVGYPFGQTVQRWLMVLPWIWSYGSALAMFGLFLGVPQWWILRRHVQRAGLWIVVSMIGWVLTGVTWIASRAGDGLDALVFGLVTGCGLVWLLHLQPAKRREA